MKITPHLFKCKYKQVYFINYKQKKSEKAVRYSFTYRKCNLIYIINQII